MSALSPNVVSEVGDAASDSKVETPLIFVARMENARVIYTLLSTLYFGKRTEVPLMIFSNPISLLEVNLDDV